ncbi:hypothetical protein [Streptomyces sp. NPDC052302]|uniref:hypothetical protein n=1 Tax=Streptomyces sp. NPDC052302 TaxID=3365688 RepID=UPI0037D61D10
MPSADEILQKMKALQAQREESIEPLVGILAQRSELLDQLAALEEPYGRAYVAAEAGGWTPDELAKMGAEEPAKRPRARSRRSRAAARKAEERTSAAASEGSSPAGTIPAQDGAAADESTAISTATA